jgi:hypothetical protein
MFLQNLFLRYIFLSFEKKYIPKYDEIHHQYYSERKKKRILTLTLEISTIINKINIVSILDIQAISIDAEMVDNRYKGNLLGQCLRNPSIRLID